MMKEARIARELLPFLKSYPRLFCAVICFGIAGSLAEGVGISLFLPFLTMFDSTHSSIAAGNWLVVRLGGLFERVPEPQRLALISSAIFGCIFLKALLSYVHTLFFRSMEARLGHKMRSTIFRQIQTVGPGFLDQSHIGRLLNTLSTETWKTGEAFATAISLVVMLGTIIVYSMLLLLISWKLTLYVVGGMAFISLVLRFMSGRVKNLGRCVTLTNEVLFDRMVEGVEGAKIIRAFGKETHEQERFDHASKRVSKAIRKLQFASGAVAPLYEVLTAALLVITLLVTLRDPENLPIVLVFIFVLYRLQPRISALETARVHLVSLLASVEDVARLLFKEDKPYIRSGSLNCRGLKPEIEFSNVSFCYDGASVPAVRNINLVIPAGKITALVGPSGGGKSTLTQLLLRFYDVSEGMILVDGVPLPELALSEWRRRIAWVSQDVYLFNTTIQRNIAYGGDHLAEEKIVEAAMLADAHDFIIQLPQGYQTKVGDKGVRLSGGQRQRIALARAIVRNPEILILDEATNSLDPISEQLIQDSLDRLSANRTVIVIAHRLSTVERADQIVVLEQGTVQEEGAWSDLLERGGLFSKLYYAQSKAPEEWNNRPSICPI